MATSTIKKGAMVLEGSKLTIFGDWGCPDGKSWILPFIGGAGIQVDPEPISPNIQDIINNDIRDGNDDKIVSVQVSPRTAVLLYLEGKITRKDIERAVADDESITFPATEFDTEKGVLSFPVIVKADNEYGAATLDKDGNIV